MHAPHDIFTTFFSALHVNATPGMESGSGEDAFGNRVEVSLTSACPNLVKAKDMVTRQFIQTTPQPHNSGSSFSVFNVLTSIITSFTNSYIILPPILICVSLLSYWLIDHLHLFPWIFPGPPPPDSAVNLHAATIDDLSTQIALKIARALRGELAERRRETSIEDAFADGGLNHVALGAGAKDKDKNAEREKGWRSVIPSGFSSALHASARMRERSGRGSGSVGV